ncbi:MAG: ribosome biogenesis GTPase Der [Deltaproteobacteria bacterium]|nr:ribosome biogenesis GTPase Der [Deltaproteobacteria bacterium]
MNTNTERIPTVAIVGRPNVGKSRLVNRLMGRDRAIVHNEPGVTRDRLYGEVNWRGRTFQVIDTGGIPTETLSSLSTSIRRQIEFALEEADLFCFVVDRKELHPLDKEIGNWLRSFGKPIILAVNKVDVASHESDLLNFYELGMEPLLAISAEEGRGIDSLLDAFLERLPATEKNIETLEMSIAILGRPNVGKSSLFNRLLQSERSVVDEKGGTTRDAVNSFVTLKGERIQLVDTAGIRRKSRVAGKLEKVSVKRALDQIEKNQIVWLVIDAPEGVVDQEQQLAQLIYQKNRPTLIVANKIDKIPFKDREPLLETLKNSFYFLPGIPLYPTSALTGHGVTKLLPEAHQLKATFGKRISTSELNKFAQTTLHRIRPSFKGKTPNLLYLTQTSTSPPTFTLFFSEGAELSEAYKRFFRNEIQKGFGFESVPIRLFFRAGRLRLN